jgi:DNA ligase (NAD+)
LAAREPIFNYFETLNFNMLITPLVTDQSLAQTSPISGQGIVFTGKMVQGTRPEMQTVARNLGARVQTSVSGATDILVCGAKVGTKKLEKARSLGVRIITEEEFLVIVNDKTGGTRNG